MHRVGNSQGNVILFEPSTSEHISSKTIFDPITSLAPASDCRTFAIGCVSSRACHFTPLLTMRQLPQRLDSHRVATAVIYHLAHAQHAEAAFANHQSGVAWLVLEAKVGHACHAVG